MQQAQSVCIMLVSQKKGFLAISGDTFLLCLLYKVSWVALLSIFGDWLAFDLLCDLFVSLLDNFAFNVRASPVPRNLVTDFGFRVRHAAADVQDHSRL